MVSDQSYTITTSNNKTECEAVAYLLGLNQDFVSLNKESRKIIMSIFKLDNSFSRAFDLVLFSGDGGKELIEENMGRMVLVELKTTKKKLVNNPHGFFFGATENEFKLAKKLGDKYFFVSLVFIQIADLIN